MRDAERKAELEKARAKLKQNEVKISFVRPTKRLVDIWWAG